MRKYLYPLGALVLAAVSAGCGKATPAASRDGGHSSGFDAGLIHTLCTTNAECDDGVACTSDFCDPVDGCQHRPADELCDDHLPCTRDLCDLHQGCLHQADDTKCDDGVSCTTDVCDPSHGGCVHTPVDSACNDQNVCTDDRCDLVQGCQHTGKNDGFGCDDSNLCNGHETCRSATCTPGTALDCDDHNPCTADSCDPVTGCQHTPVTNGISCDDGNACNGAETCQSGQCQAGTPLNCTSPDPCHAASCDPDGGCGLQPLSGVSCEDGDVCNGTDTCQAGLCTHSGALTCTPVDACHSAVCSPTQGCVQTALDNTSCDDGNACNGTDTCVAGVCTHSGAPNCVAPDACHAASCQADAGCVLVALDNVSCDDGNVCNGTDICQGGICTHSGALPCAPTDSCHSAVCDPSLGCQQTALNGSSCDDGNACNGSDTCVAGTCTHSGGPACNPPDVCHVAACDADAGCVIVAAQDGTSCNDNDVCNGTDTCQAGVCTHNNPLNCTPVDSCHSATCSPTQGCIQTALSNTSCNDGNACNGTDVCQSGVCTHNNPPSCASPDVCHVAVCDPAQGCILQPVANGTSCEDGNVCNGADTCQDGSCTHTNPLSCTAVDSCHSASCSPTLGCVQTPLTGTSCDDGNACNGTDTCSNGTCTHSGAPACSAPDVCHSAACQPDAGCVITALSGTSCDDSNVCNGTDTCQAGTCTHSGTLPCAPIDSCHSAACSPTLGCVQTPLTGTSCDDGNACNGADTCQNGTCTHSGGPSCNPPDLCHVATCQADAGCVIVNAANGTSCNDNDVCNGTDTCSNGTCTHNNPLTCTAVDACHSASCNAATGCVQTPLNGTSCNDNDACNGTDTCSNGTCTHSGAPNCNDNNACTNDSCNPASGCVHSAVTCNDGKSCTVDTCQPDAGCVFTPDDTKCTSGPACNEGTCDPSTGDPTTGCHFYADNYACTSAGCADAYCDPTLGCEAVARNVLCADTNAATQNVCNAVSGCTYPATPCGQNPRGEVLGAGNVLFSGSTASGAIDSATFAPNTPNNGDCPFVANTGGLDAIYGITLTNYSHVHLDSFSKLPDGGVTAFGSPSDSVVYLRSSSCGSSASQLACGDDLPDGGRLSYAEADLGPGQYYAFIDGYDSTKKGAYVFHVQVSPIDTCAYVKDVGAGGTFTGDTYGLNDDYQSSGAGSCSGVGYGADAVFKATVPSGKTKLHVNTMGSALDTVVYVRSGSCTAGTELGCNDDALDAQGNAIGRYSDLTVNVTAGSTYYIFMDCFSGSDGPWVLNVSFQ